MNVFCICSFWPVQRLRLFSRYHMHHKNMWRLKQNIWTSQSVQIQNPTIYYKSLGIRKMCKTKLAHELVDEVLETKRILSTWISHFTLILTPSFGRSCASFGTPPESDRTTKTCPAGSSPAVLICLVKYRYNFSIIKFMSHSYWFISQPNSAYPGKHYLFER
jgi:hypothetical protein